MSNRDYDVIVVGGGGAGLAAAILAHDARASVMILEADTKLGGSTMLAGGVFFAAGTSVQRQRGIDDTPDAMFDYLMCLNQWELQSNLIRKLCDLSGPTLEWLIELSLWRRRHGHRQLGDLWSGGGKFRGGICIGIGGNVISIPRVLDDITPRWLTQILSLRHPDVVVTSATVGDFIGYKPNKTRVQLEYNDSGRKAGFPASLFVKGGFMGKNEGMPSGIDAGLDIGTEIEVLAYQDLRPHLDINMPDCLYVAFDREIYTGILVLEDLVPKGVTFLKEQPSLHCAQAALFIDEFARQHARWIDTPALAAGGLFGPESDLGRRSKRLHAGYFDHMATHSHWQDFLALPRGAALPRGLQDARRMAAAHMKMKEVHQTCAMTIIHGDEHLGNLYVDAMGQPGFIDWAARHEPWVVAFTYFLISTIDAHDRPQWERPLLQRYLRQLAFHGVPAPGFEEAWYAYLCTILFPFLTWFNNSAKWQPEAVNTRNCMRAALAMRDHDVLGLLGV